MIFPRAFTVSIALIATLAGSTFGTPVPHHPNGEAHEVKRRTESFSLNKWSGFESLAGFDDFFGVDNFDGFFNQHNIFAQNAQLVCQAQQVNIVQQQLAILQEFSKRLILEQLCEVEVQALVFQQFISVFDNFGSDLRRENGRVPGFDNDVAGLLLQLQLDGNKLNSIDFGVKGSQIGNKFVVVGGDNWNDNNSLENIFRAEAAARRAIDTSRALKLGL